MRIAVLLRDRCQPRKCAYECINFCPRVRTGDDTIVKGEKGKPIISEELCVGCGICVNKCPFEAIKIIGLPEALEEDLVQQFGMNGFRLFRLPIPREGQVVGLLGPNGIGKTTAVNILSGNTIPNMGDYENEPTWERALDSFAGTPLSDHMKKVADGNITTAFKPQYVDNLTKVAEGNVKDLLMKVDDEGRLDEIAELMEITDSLNRDIKTLSGGELQRVAISACLLKTADIYFFDEPSSYLDIYQRLRISHILKDLSEKAQVIVIEHDLAILDFLADNIHLMYGSPGAYGVMAHPRGVREGINTFLDGYMAEENIRFRDWSIEFTTHPPREEWESGSLLYFERLKKQFPTFNLETLPGTIHRGEVVGILGPNASGKTTFVKMLADEIEPDDGKVDADVKVSYKPQYIKGDYDGQVVDMYYTQLGERMEDTFYQTEIEHPLELKRLYSHKVSTLSGGELQRVAVGLCLGREADLYLLDEPSAYLDVNQRMIVAKTIRRVMEKSGKSGLIVDHDIYFSDIISDSIMVFSGEGGKWGLGQGPYDMRDGMNRFLKAVDITFRRDAETKRPRINKKDSKKDREQKSAGEYYYL